MNIFFNISLTGVSDTIKSVYNLMNNLNPNGRENLILLTLCICLIIYLFNRKQKVYSFRFEKMISNKENKINILKWLYVKKKFKKKSIRAKKKNFSD